MQEFFRVLHIKQRALIELLMMKARLALAWKMTTGSAAPACARTCHFNCLWSDEGSLRNASRDYNPSHPFPRSASNVPDCESDIPRGSDVKSSGKTLVCTEVFLNSTVSTLKPGKIT